MVWLGIFRIFCATKISGKTRGGLGQLYKWPLLHFFGGIWRPPLTRTLWWILLLVVWLCSVVWSNDSTPRTILFLPHGVCVASEGHGCEMIEYFHQCKVHGNSHLKLNLMKVCSSFFHLHLWLGMFQETNTDSEYVTRACSLSQKSAFLSVHWRGSDPSSGLLFEFASPVLPTVYSDVEVGTDLLSTCPQSKFTPRKLLGFLF